jgi:hypothetical protein
MLGTGVDRGCLIECRGLVICVALDTVMDVESTIEGNRCDKVRGGEPHEWMRGG